MIPKKRHLFVFTLLGNSFALTVGFQNPASTCNKLEIRITSKTTGTSLCNVPEPLAEEDTWQAFLDEETTGLVYYFDTSTGESRWEPPTSTFPQVRLPRRKQRLADNLRSEYRKKKQEMMDVYESDEVRISAGGVGGIFSTVTSVLEQRDKSKSDDTLDAFQTQKDQPSGGWFDSLFDDGRSDEETKENLTSPVENTEEEESIAPKTIFDSLFGGGSMSVEEDLVEDAAAEDNNQKVGNNNGLLDSLSSPFFSSVNAPGLEDDFPQKITSNSSPKSIEIEIGAHVLPHPAKVRWGGEDATFVKGRTFGVFDGVSGAEKLDGVPLYSRTLANEMKRQCGTSGETLQDMTAYLTSAASYADGAATGASTAVVASIGENGFLQALNVGDSSCMVIRDGKVTAKTREISHYWECPYQLSEDSPDQPKDGTKLNIELMSGDLVIMGSDGVFDNVNDDTLLDLVAEYRAIKPTSFAKRICDLSRKVSLDKTAVTPYSKQAQRRGDTDYQDGLGGKVDDVSCVVVACK